MPTDAELFRHGLTQDEHARIVASLGRAPNELELGIFGAMWSEHCAYKSSKRFLRRLPTTGPRVLQGPGENAGVVDIGGGLAVAFKMESHNHPSYIEPYQGAATGVGGILRDVFTMGARPIAVLNSLRFGSPSHPRTAHLVEGVVAGIGGYGNAVGIPTVGGEVAFDSSYDGNCLVNAMAVGLIKSDRIFRGTASGVGNPVFYVGARTGKDGIHGATMASAEFNEGSEQLRPTVQVGDPFTEKLLLEACLEIMRTDALVGIQDMGAAGLTSSSAEMAGRAGSGLELDLDRVPRRESGMTPYDVMLSESQERMLLVCKQGREEEVLRVFGKWDLSCVQIGKVTTSGHLVLRDAGSVVGDIPVTLLTDEAPVYERPTRAPADFAERQRLPAFAEPSDLGATLLQLLAAPNIASKEWIYRQYDHMVRLGAAVRCGDGDAAVVRLTGQSAQGLAIAVDCNSRYVSLDPRLGAAHAVVECARNIACVGGEPLAVTDCLNFGNPERPEVLWQLEQSVEGIREACEALGTPVISGNVSLYNETNGSAIFPTPTIGMVGLCDDASRTVGMAFRQRGHRVILLGETRGHLGASEFLSTVHGLCAGAPPPLDLEAERRLQHALRKLIRDGLAASAHDCSDGGVAVALSECCISGSGPHLGADVTLPGLAHASDAKSDPGASPALLGGGGGQGLLSNAALLFGEDAGRAIVSCAAEHAAQVLAICSADKVPAADIGAVGGMALVMRSGGDVLVTTPLGDLDSAWRGGISKALRL